MSNYVHLIIQVTTQQETDMLVALLSRLSFSGFEETTTELHAYVLQRDYKEIEINKLLVGLNKQFVTTVVKARNWNALWESNFEPVTVGGFCNIRAHFHQPNTKVLYDLEITPKMSFGTGHHATTYMMVEQMQHLDFKNKIVADFGTGTGVLAILAEKLGCNKVWAIDEDENSIENAAENLTRNNCNRVQLHKASLFSSPGPADIILANINKNVIIDNVEGFIKSLSPAGKVLLSGLLKQDEYDVLMACQLYNLNRVKTVERDKWIAILLER